MDNKKQKSLTIHNIKSGGFRQIHVDGAHGGVTPTGLININFYSQRSAIPKGTEFKLDKNKQLGDVVKNIEGSKDGIVREFEFGTYMDIHTCKSLRDFLNKKIEELENIQK